MFYNVIHHRFLVINLNFSNLANLGVAKTEMFFYMRAIDLTLNQSFQKKTIGLVLGKHPVNVAYANYLEQYENLYYSQFIARVN